MHFIDLTHLLYHACPGWPTYRPAQIGHETLVGVDGYTSERLDINTHTGTHLDVPYHFYPDKASVDQVPLSSFMGEALLVNLHGIPSRTAITQAHLEPLCKQIQPGMIVVLYTGWCGKRGYSKEYYHDWPYLSGEGAKYLLQKQVKGVGIDCLSMGGWYEGTGCPCHEVLLSHGIWLLEELNIPEELLDYPSFHLTAVPLRIKGAGGSPARAYATVNP